MVFHYLCYLFYIFCPQYSTNMPSLIFFISSYIPHVRTIWTLSYYCIYYEFNTYLLDTSHYPHASIFCWIIYLSRESIWRRIWLNYSGTHKIKGADKDGLMENVPREQPWKTPSHGKRVPSLEEVKETAKQLKTIKVLEPRQIGLKWFELILNSSSNYRLENIFY